MAGRPRGPTEIVPLNRILPLQARNQIWNMASLLPEISDTDACVRWYILVLLILSSDQINARKKKKTSTQEDGGVAYKLDQMVATLKQTGVLDHIAAEKLGALSTEIRDEFQQLKQNSAVGGDLKEKYEKKLHEMQRTYDQMVKFKESLPADVITAERDIRNCRAEVQDLETEIKRWNDQTSVLTQDLKKAYELHKQDQAKLKSIVKDMKTKEMEIERLEKAVKDGKERFDALQKHVIKIDTIEAEHSASGVQAALKQKDERIQFLKEHNMRVTQSHNEHVAMFRKRIEELETDNARLMEKGPSRQDNIKLNERVESCTKELQDTKTTLMRKEQLYEDLQIVKNTLVGDVTSWNKKWADCSRASKEAERIHQEEVAAFKAASSEAPSSTAEGACDCAELKQQTEDIQLVNNNLIHDVSSWNYKWLECTRTIEGMKEAHAEEIAALQESSAAAGAGNCADTKDLENKMAAQEKTISELKESSEDNLALREEMKRKDELIDTLRKYNDPSGCMKDRVTQQKNLDRMAQENMKWANCNVRAKKLRVKYEQLLNSTGGEASNSSDTFSQLNQLQNDNHKLRKEVETLTNTLKDVRETKQEMYKEYQHFKTACKVKEHKLTIARDHYKEGLDKVTQESLEKDSKIVIYQGKLKHLQEQEAKMEEELKSCKESGQTSSGGDDFEEKLKAKEKDLEFCEGRAKFLMDINSKMSNNTNKLQEEVKELKEKLQAKTGSPVGCKDVEEKLKQAEENVEIWEGRDEKLELIKEVKAYKEEIESLKGGAETRGEGQGDCNEERTKLAEQKAEMERKDEIIDTLRKYNDPSGCMKDRVTQQKNLNRMAQENMKWANCNVRKKKCEAKVETLTSEAKELQAKNTDLEAQVAELQSKAPEAPKCEEVKCDADIEEMKVSIKQKDELIDTLRKYNDPSGCMKDRVTQQKNLDRMAQENMKWANCNVRKKKLEAKLATCQQEASSKEKELQDELRDAKNLAGQVNFENDRLRQEVQKWKKLNDQAREQALEGDCQKNIEDASQVIFLQTKQDILNEKINTQRKQMEGLDKHLHERIQEFAALNKTHQQALSECNCKTMTLEGETVFVPNCALTKEEAEISGVTDSSTQSKDAAECAQALQEVTKDRDMFKEEFMQSSGKFTECKMAKHEVHGENLHLKKAMEKMKEKMTGLQEGCNCELLNSCPEESLRFEAMQDKALNCENTLVLVREKLDKCNKLEAEASKNYTELRVECSAYYHDLQACNAEKSEIEFIKNGQDMVLKQIDSDNAKKTADLESRTKEAVKYESQYRNYFLACAVILVLLGGYDLNRFIKRRLQEHEVQVREAKAKAKESKKKR